MALDGDIEIDQLLARVSKKLGWLSFQETGPEQGKKPLEKQRTKKKLVQHNSKKGKKCRKGTSTSSSSDKENSVKGRRQHGHPISPSADKGRSEHALFRTCPSEEPPTMGKEESERLLSPNDGNWNTDCRDDDSFQSLRRMKEIPEDATNARGSLAKDSLMEMKQSGNKECEIQNGSCDFSKLDEGEPTRCNQESLRNSHKSSPVAEGRPLEFQNSPRDDLLSSSDEYRKLDLATTDAEGRPLEFKNSPQDGLLPSSGSDANSSLAISDAEGCPLEFGDSPQDDGLLSLDEDEVKTGQIAGISSDEGHQPSSDDEREKDQASGEPFSPAVPFSETLEPIRWVLTPPSKQPGPKTTSPADKIQMAFVSDSDSDSDSDLPSFHRPDTRHSPAEELLPVELLPSSDTDDGGLGRVSLDNDPGTAGASRTLPAARIADGHATDSGSDPEEGGWAPAPSLRERLSKNLRKRKEGRRGKAARSGEERRGNCGPPAKGRGGGDGDPEDCSSEEREDVASPKERSESNARVSRYISSDDDDDDDFEQFLQAIKTPRQAAKLPSSPSEDEDQYESSFIDDTPIKEVDSDEDLFYFRQINSDKKVNPKRDSKKTSTFSNYRLPKFSDSDSDDDLADSVFATPKPPAVKQHVPKIVTSTKKATPVPSRRMEAPITTTTPSSESDFLASLSTPKVGRTSSSPYVRDFKRQRAALTHKLFTIYNRTVFDNKLPSDFLIKWNNRMRKTAGYCYYTKTRLGGHRSAKIELSEKVCDTAERLRDTLIHELCHASCWLINGVNDGHGRFWKYWAAKANKAHPSIPVIKRCHSYEITTKYKYQCVACKTTIGRHSKSINTAKFCCAYCQGSLVLLPSLGKDGKVAKARTPNRFAMFVKENYGTVKKGHASLKHAEIMRLLSQDFAKKASVST